MEYTWTNETDAAVDEKLGLIAVRIPFRVRPASGESKLATLKRAIAIRPSEIDDLGLPLIRRSLKEDRDGSYLVTFQFDGVDDPGKADGREDYSLEGTTSEDPIESHPEIQTLIDKYSGEVDDDGKVKFPISIEANGKPIPNPLYGIKSYMVPGLVWTRSFLATSFPDDLARQLGAIGTPPSGNGQSPPRLSGKRDWIMVRLRADWRGNIWRGAESWMVSGENGATPDVYPYR